ncbi:MAG: hypothetical protein QNJ91_03420 [Gammaproteobacteria bacterium]|nr:hypothetical protein [Gammaproteobacteria bacterium]
MPRFIFVYLGGEYPTDPAQGKAHFDRYQQWLHALGNAVVSPAVPFKDTHTVQPGKSPEAGSTTAMSGLSILDFGSMEEALGAAQSCPFLEIQGVLEVSEMIELTGDPGAGGSAPN